MILKVKALLAGLSTYIPGYRFMRPTGGTDSARYCYSIWLRHLTLAYANDAQHAPPVTVAELGPGDSIGIGLAALLSGVEEYHALDIVHYPDLKSNLAVFDELVGMFTDRQSIPADDEFPLAHPKLDDYAFPSHMLNNELLDKSLDPQRIAEIRSSIEQAEEEQSRIHYQAPWNDPRRIRENSIDLIYSQAVLEHVDDLAGVYSAMRRWLKPEGRMSHQIDFKSHGKADTWDGHWTYSDMAWKVVVGRQPYLLNRKPHSEHLRQLRANGFRVVMDRRVHSDSNLRKSQLAIRFRHLSDEDLTTSGAFVVATKDDQRTAPLQ